MVAEARRLEEILAMCDAEKTATAQLASSDDYQAHWLWDEMAREELPRLAKAVQSLRERLDDTCPVALEDDDCACDRDGWTDICETPRECAYRKLAHIFREAGVRP